MKIILSKSGGGKLGKIASLMAELSHKEKESLIITNEVNVSEFKSLAIEAEANLEFLRYSYAATLEDVCDAIENKEDEKVKFMFVNFITKDFFDKKDELLKTLKKLGIENGKTLCTAVQTPAQTGEEGISVVEYTE